MLKYCPYKSDKPGKKYYITSNLLPSMLVIAGETDRDLAATQFTKICVVYNIIHFKKTTKN
jgi:hypothetical protein